MIDVNATIDGLRKAAEELARYAPLKVNERCQSCFDVAIHALKEQEPVKVYHLHNTKVIMHEEIVFTDECGNCSGYLLKSWKACPICGRKVKWDD